MPNYLIQNARVVNEGAVCEADVRVRDGRFARIGGAVAARADETTIDAQGRWLLPGLIDDQVHFRQPGLTHKATIRTESRAAVAGGITSYMEMPNVNPTTTNRERLQEKLDIAARDSLANYAFYLGAATDNLEDIKSIDPKLIAGIKIFMGSSTGTLLVDEESHLEKIFQHAPTLIATHCENNPRVAERLGAARAQYGDDIPARAHATIRDDEACYLSSSLAVRLAKQTGARLHILHITTAKELSLFSNAPLADKKITSEACVHHLLFCDDDYESLGMLIKCNPAIKTADDRAAVRAAVASGQIDVLATDHAPHLLAEKQQPYEKAVAGLSLAEYALPAFLELVADEVLPITTIATAGAHRVAKLFNIAERGFIREGYYADFVLVEDCTAAPAAIRTPLLSKCQWTPFQKPFRHRVWKTFVNGACVWEDEKICEVACAQPLKFNR